MLIIEQWYKNDKNSNIVAGSRAWPYLVQACHLFTILYPWRCCIQLRKNEHRPRNIQPPNFTAGIALSLWFSTIYSRIILVLSFNSNELQSIVETANDTDETTTTITIDRGYCGNHFNESDESQHRCMLHNSTARCYGRAIDLQHIKAQHAHDVRQIIFCNWQNETFDPMILTKFTKLKAFHMEYGMMKYLANDFPQLYHLQVSGWFDGFSIDIAPQIFDLITKPQTHITGHQYLVYAYCDHKTDSV